MEASIQHIIFLDIDGVLCTQPIWKPDNLAEDGYSEFNPICVENLNRLVEQTRASVILTSTRRINKSLDEFQAIMQKRGFRGKIAAKINDNTLLRSVSRGAEIREWIQANGLPASFVILDDDARVAEIGKEYMQHWVKTIYHRGLDAEALQTALAILQAT